MRIGGRLFACLAAVATLVSPAAAGAQIVVQTGVQISQLSDIAFGTVSVTSDATQSENVCAYSTLALGRYTVTATGSGAGGAFALQSGGANLPYDVQWNSASGASSGTALSPGTPLSGQTSGAVTAGCVLGILSAGSLIVSVRAANVQSATAGNYSGTLTILLSAL